MKIALFWDLFTDMFNEQRDTAQTSPLSEKIRGDILPSGLMRSR
jgi:hypothetical protein